MKRTIYAIAISAVLLSSVLGFLTSCHRTRTRQDTRVEHRTEERMDRRRGD